MRAHALGRKNALLAVTVASFIVIAGSLALPATAASGSTGGSALPDNATGSPDGSSGGGPGAGPPEPTTPGATARLSANGRTALAPVDAPVAVKQAIRAANQITRKPYRYGGGHRSFNDSGYDCSGAVSYALHGAGILPAPLHSRALARWGEEGPGRWITVYTSPGHAYVVIAGLRFDTSGPGERGPRWRRTARSSHRYEARHFEGL